MMGILSMVNNYIGNLIVSKLAWPNQMLIKLLNEYTKSRLLIL